MKALIAVAAVAMLAGCASSHQCVQPDPTQPAHGIWDKGVNAGEPLVPFNGTK